MNFFRNLFSFRGRIDRAEYFLSMIAVYAVPITASLILSTTGYEADLEKGDTAAYLVFPILIGLLWMMLAAMTKRFHDINWSGWSCLLLLVPLVGGLATIVLLFWPGTSGENKYGAQPA